MAVAEKRPALGAIPAFWRIRDWRVGVKLLIAFLLVAIISVAATGLLGIRMSRDALLAEGITYLMTKSSSTGSVIDQYLLMHREDLVSGGKLSSIVAFATNPNDAIAKATALKELRALATKPSYHYESFAIANPAGTIILSSSDAEIGSIIKEKADFQGALAGSPMVTDVMLSIASPQPVVFFSAPIQDTNNRILGVLRGSIVLDGIREWVHKDTDAAGPGTFGILLSENAVRISVGAEMKTPAEVAAAMSKPGTQVFGFSTESTNVPYYAAISTLTTKPWRYVIMTPISTFTSAADNLLGQFLLIGLIVGGIAAIAAILLAGSLSRPITELTRIADRISLGELDAEIGLDRKDEIGELAEALSRMQASLQTTMERLRARRAG